MCVKGWFQFPQFSFFNEAQIVHAIAGGALGNVFQLCFLSVARGNDQLAAFFEIQAALFQKRVEALSPFHTEPCLEAVGAIIDACMDHFGIVR